MQAMLDREMPLERRRRFIWWWWSLLLLPLALYGSWQWFHSDTPSSPVKELKSTLPIANVAPKATQPQDNLVPEASTTIMSQAVALDENLASRPTQKEGSKSVVKSSANNSANQDDLEERAGVKFAPIAIANNPNNTDTPEKTLLDLQLIPAYPLDLQTHTTIQSPSREFAHLHKPIKKAVASKWALGATSFISTEQFSTINGFSTGLTVDWKFARKWGLRSGAFYNIHTPQEKYRPVASVRSSDYTSNVDGSVIVLDAVTGTEIMNVGGNNYYGDSLGGSVFIPVNRLQRVELPVSAFWQASRPLKIFAGVSFARTLSTTADRQNYSGDYILRLADKTAEDDASELSSSELDNWSADAMLGVGFNLGKMFELGFSAKMPFNDFKSLKKASYSSSLNSGITDEVGRTRERGTPVFSLYGTLFF